MKKEITFKNFIRKTLKTIGGILVALVIVIIVTLIIFDDFVEFRDNDEELARFFDKKEVPFSIGYYSSHGRNLRYLQVGNVNAPASILYLHGAPSSMSYFKPYFSNEILLQQANMLSVDRPGYGYSGLGVPETSMEMQVKMIKPIVDSLRKVHHPLIVVAASYGTSIACRLAMDYPDLIDGLVLVAPSLAPGEEKVYALAYAAENSLVKWILPGMLVSANAEKLSHQAELKKMLPLWKNITAPVIYLQGEEDRLIYPTNAVFAREKLVNASCLDIHMIPKRGHLIAFLEIKRIKTAILEMLQLSKKYYMARKNDGEQSAPTGNTSSIH